MNICLICQEANKASVRFCDNCGTELGASNAQSQLLRGVNLLGRYQILRVLGSGGFANVYLAQDMRLHRVCVVKEMPCLTASSQQDIRDRQQHFDAEVQSLVTLNHPGHPNIPEIYDYYQTSSGSYLVMKYIEGENLEQLLARKGGRLPWPLAVKIALAVCDALLYMHNRQPAPVLHGDIKPANILLDRAERIWLVDFGLSKAQAMASRVASGGCALGTAGYTPLEQWQEQAVPASDIYALGATLHHLLTGRDPRQLFAAQPDLSLVRQEHSNFPPLRRFDSTLPARLEQLLSVVVHAEPSKRPTASQLKQELESLLTFAQPPLANHALFTIAFQSERLFNTPKPIQKFVIYGNLGSTNFALSLSNPFSLLNRLPIPNPTPIMGAILNIYVWDMVLLTFFHLLNDVQGLMWLEQYRLGFMIWNAVVGYLNAEAFHSNITNNPHDLNIYFRQNLNLAALSGGASGVIFGIFFLISVIKISFTTGFELIFGLIMSSVLLTIFFMIGSLSGYIWPIALMPVHQLQKAISSLWQTDDS